MFSLIKNSFGFVAELVRQATEDDRKLTEARIDLKLEKEKSYILYDKRQNDIMINKLKNCMSNLYKNHALEMISKGYDLLEVCTNEEKSTYHSLVSDFHAYMYEHLERVYIKFLGRVGGCRCTIQETANYFKCTLNEAEYILERLTASGYMDKFIESGKKVYYSRYDFPNESHPFWVNLTSNSEALEEQLKMEEQVTLRELGTQKLNDNIFEYAEKRLDNSSYKLFNSICLRGSLTVKDASKLLKCRPDRARYLLEQLYGKGYIKKRKIEGNRNLYISKWG